ncbi:MAG: cytochrome b/b6 domain-containing protein [Chthonomonadaceae bacterium]|nr:cytochrome b/b6 domain-containing protein [Chthonomonadaceae bacterium]
MKQISKKHPLAIRWFHWINFPVLFTMIWSGMLIYWANDVYHVGFGDKTALKLFPDWFYAPKRLMDTPLEYHLDSRLSEGMAWHFLTMWFFFFNGLMYVLYTAISGEWRYLLPNRHSAKEAFQVVLHDLHIRKEPLPPRKFNGAQQIAYTSVVIMGIGSLLTGLSIYKPTQFAWLTTSLGGYETARFIHFWLTMGYLGFFLIHVTQVIKAGWNNFRAMVTGYEVIDVPASASTSKASPAEELRP